MPDPRTQLERDEAELERALDAGEMSPQEYQKAMAELHRDYRAEAEEAAWEAAQAERDRWF